MALELWLMRHGEAEDADRAGSDAERGLTERGRRQCAAVGRWLAERAEPPQLILHSPLKRARQTAEVLANGVALQEEPELGPGMRSERLLGLLNGLGLTRVVCVGHQPDIGECLKACSESHRVQIPPGTLAVVTFSTTIATVGGGVLRGLLDPRWFSDQ